MEPKSLEQIISEFSEALDALRDFVSNVAPVVKEKEEGALKASSELIAPYQVARLLLSPDESLPLEFPEETRNQFDSIRKILTVNHLDLPADKKEELTTILKKLLPIKLVDGKLELDLDQQSFLRIMEKARATQKAEAQVRLLYESALLALTSRSEWFIAQLVHAFFAKFPDTIGPSEPVFSLKDLQEIGSIAEAKAALIETRVDSLMRGSFEDWVAFFKKNPKLGMSYLEGDEPRISEIYKRRNLIVHNGGRISRRYLDGVPTDYRESAKIGETIVVSPEYLQSSIDILEKQFILLGAELWKKLEPKEEGRGNLLNNCTISHLNQKRWSIAEGLSYFSTNDKGLSEYSRMCGQINLWQSYKWSGRYDKIRNEVEGAELSAKKSVFKLCRLALMSDFDSFFELLPAVMSHGELSAESLASWPIFQEVRLRPEAETYLPPKEPNATDQNPNPSELTGDLQKPALLM